MRGLVITIIITVIAITGTAVADTRDIIKPLPRLIVVNYDDASAEGLYDYCAALPAGVFHYNGNVYQSPVIHDVANSDTYDWFNESFKGYLDGHGGLQLLTAIGGVDATVVDDLQSYYGVSEGRVVEYPSNDPVSISAYVSREWVSSDDAVFCYYNSSPSDGDVQSVVNAAALASALNCPLFFVTDHVSDEVCDEVQRLGVSSAYYVGIGGTITAGVKSVISGFGVMTDQDLTTEVEVATYITSRISEAVICFYDPDDLGQAMAAAYAAATHEGFAAPIPSTFIAKGETAAAFNELYATHQIEKLPAPLPYNPSKSGEQSLANDFIAYVEGVGAYKNNALEAVYTFDLKSDLDVAFDRAILGDPREPNNDGAIAGRYLNDGEIDILQINYTSLYKALIYNNLRPGHVTFMAEAYEAGYNTTGYAGQFTDNDGQTHIVNEVIRWSGKTAPPRIGRTIITKYTAITARTPVRGRIHGTLPA